MNENYVLPFPRDLLKSLDLEHLDQNELELLRKGALNKDSMCWAVRHLSECPKCCRDAPHLSGEQIRAALTGTRSGRTDLIEQTINYYFRTLSES